MLIKKLPASSVKKVEVIIDHEDGSDHEEASPIFVQQQP